MHWLLILALITSTTGLKDQSAKGSALNRLAENALRQQLGSSVKTLRVDLRRGTKGKGDFDYFNVVLDGFSADKLLGLDKKSRSSSFAPSSLKAGDIFSGGGIGDILNNPNIGDILGNFTSQGRVGKMQVNASNFTFDGVRYDGLTFGINELKFNWAKALRGDLDIQSMQPGNLALQLDASQAERLVTPRLPSIKNVKLRFDDGLVYLGGKADLYGLGVPFEAGGKLSIQTNQVRADNLRLSVAKVRLPSLVMNELTKSVNPLYDFDPDKKWPLAVNLNTAATDNNLLSMSGGLQWVGFNRKDKDERRSKDDPKNKDDDSGLPYKLPFPR